MFTVSEVTHGHYVSVVDCDAMVSGMEIKLVSLRGDLDLRLYPFYINIS